MKPGLGTQLRHLIELLDAAVETSYEQAGLDYRPRYTPVMRALLAQEPMTIGEIAAHAGLTQPAATQTVALMIKEGWLSATTGTRDGRQKMIALSPTAHEQLPRLRACWQATGAAADDLDAELPHPLSSTLASAIDALSDRSFGERIRAARAGQAPSGKTAGPNDGD